MARPLFDAGRAAEQAGALLDAGASDSDDDEDGKSRKGVRFATDVQDHQRGDGHKALASSVRQLKNKKPLVPGPGQGLVAVDMMRTKIGFDADELRKMYKGQETEKVWIDFGKVNSNVLRYDPLARSTMDFGGHKLYYMLPPSLSLLPSNVIVFELVYLSSKNSLKDVVVGWGAFPIVNGEFEINTGKFKVPMLYGGVDWSTNKFKDIEQKYMRNIDEWLCNLYIDVRKVDLFDFRFHEEKIEFLVPKKFKKALEAQQKRKALLETRAAGGFSAGGSTRDSSNDDGDGTSDGDGSGGSDYSGSDAGGDSDEGFEPLSAPTEAQAFEDDSRIDYQAYRYCVSKDDTFVASEALARDTAVRRAQFILSEIVVDLGIAKGTPMESAKTAALAMFVLYLRMIIHYLGQWFVLKIVNAPVTSMVWKWYEIRMEYAYWTMGQQLLVVMAGPFFNTILFVFCITVCHLAQKFIHCFPVKLCKFIAWYGLATCLDFFLIAVIDIANQNTDGDLFKLYNYYEKRENSGFIGFFMTFLVQFAMILANVFIFYNYIVFVHNDARIHDIYMRISGLGKGYHIPFDNEISWSYLKQTYCLGELNNNRIVVNQFRVQSAVNYLEPPLVAKCYQFQRFINEAAVATEEVYYATEKGQILDLTFKEMRTFRTTPLYDLIGQVESTIGRMGRPNAAIEAVKRARAARGRNMSVAQRSPTGSMHNDSILGSNQGGGGRDRAGTVHFVKNVLVQRLRNQQQSILSGDKGLSGLDASSFVGTPGLAARGPGGNLTGIADTEPNQLAKNSSLIASAGQIGVNRVTSVQPDVSAFGGFKATGGEVNFEMAPEEESGASLK